MGTSFDETSASSLALSTLYPLSRALAPSRSCSIIHFHITISLASSSNVAEKKKQKKIFFKNNKKNTRNIKNGIGTEILQKMENPLYSLCYGLHCFPFIIIITWLCISSSHKKTLHSPRVLTFVSMMNLPSNWWREYCTNAESERKRNHTHTQQATRWTCNAHFTERTWF